MTDAVGELIQSLKVEDYLNQTDYQIKPGYVPSDFALGFVTFIKLVNGEEGEENLTPLVHYYMLDTLTHEGSRIINLCHRGVAKLQSASSKIMTPSGWRTMGDLQVGDYVVSRYGVPERINYKTDPQYPTMYRMSLSDGTVMEVGDEHNHVVMVRSGGSWKERVVTTKELLAAGLTYNSKPRQNTRDGKVQYRWRIPLTEPVQFTEKVLPLHPYTLGLAIANANYQGGYLSCHARDLEELKASIVAVGDTVQSSSVPAGLAGRMYIGKVLGKWYGNTLSQDKTIPQDALYGSVAQRTALLQGLMDGDGSIAQNGGCSYSTSSTQLALQVQELVQGLGGIATVKSHYREEGNRSRTSYLVRIRTVFNPFRLVRKASKWKPTKKIFKLITALEEIPCAEPGYCIHVDSADHTYLTEGYTVTHNTTLMAEYLFLYIATYGTLPGLGKVNLALYVSDSIENGVKNMRKNLEYRWENSEFLRQYVPNIRLTDVRWEFCNADGKVFIVKGYGAKTGVRGAKEMGQRPTLAVLDDLISDEDARSATVIAAIEDTVYKAINYALHPKRNMIIWSGTPFNSRDPLYKAVESGAWAVNVFPVCEVFPCKPEEFRGSWPDRFTYAYVKEQYDAAVRLGKVNTFNQELMLRIMSDEDRSIQDHDIVWYKIDNVLQNKGLFNFYITTDFATSERQSADFSVISVWAYTNNGDWLWVDGICKRQLMDKNIDDLFRLAQIYRPQQVGIEVTGQQGGFVTWIMDQMMVRNIYFPLASEGNNSSPGIRPNTNKMVRFNTVLPWFKARKIGFPLEKKHSTEIVEAISELSLVSPGGFKSKHDDFLDTIAMLSSLTPWKPTQDVTFNAERGTDYWELDIEPEVHRISSYIV